MVRMPQARVWHNWSRTATAHAEHYLRARDVDEVRRVVRFAARTGLRVRVVGGGHSFTPAAVTDGVLLNLDLLDGIEAVVARADGTAHVTVGAGIRLRALNRELALRGLAMENLGDIDRQSIAGAISTGTHGAGARFGGLATQVVGVRMVTADGEVLDVDAARRPDVLAAASLSLGALGVLVAVTLRVVPAFTLRAREEPWDLDDALAALEGPHGWLATHDHVDLYWYPFTRRTMVKRNDRVVGESRAGTRGGIGAALPGLRGWVDDELLSNGVFEVTNRLAAGAPGLVPAINQVTSRGLSARTYVAPSYRVLISPRRVVFREMEYAVPRDSLADVLREVDRWLRRTGEPVPFPVEVRHAAPDDVWLSTAYQRPTAYLAVHQYHRLPHVRYFAAVEAIAAQVDGRPHWGKLHGLGADRLASLYPRYTDFRTLRSELDPGGLFTNPYTDRVLGRARPGPGARRER